MTINEIYDCFDITEEEIVIFENMNEAFNQYVYGGKNGYNASLIAYKKRSIRCEKTASGGKLILTGVLK
ncbi:MAG: hypothetical protein ACLSFA_10805 [Roseburia inulinivorans]